MLKCKFYVKIILINRKTPLAEAKSVFSVNFSVVIPLSHRILLNGRLRYQKEHRLLPAKCSQASMGLIHPIRSLSCILRRIYRTNLCA